MVRWLTYVAVLGCAVPASGTDPKKETLPAFAHLANARENSALTMECDGDPAATIECAFTQITVTVPNVGDQAKMQAEMRALTPAQRRDLRKTICAPMEPPPGLPSQRTAWRERTLSLARKACACPDDECFDAATIGLVVTSERTCKVWTHTFKATLNRVLGQRKWVGTAVSGLCQDLNATIIESDDKGTLWRFTQTRLSTDTTADACKGRKINEPTIYSWDVDSSALLNCDVITFGH